MILIKLAKNKNKTIKEAYGKYYARPVVTETIGIDELAEHMASHNTPFSKGAIKGLLTDTVSCVKELVLQNKAVKIDNLAIFSIGIINKMGAASIKEWSLAKCVEGYRLKEARSHCGFALQRTFSATHRAGQRRGSYDR